MSPKKKALTLTIPEPCGENFNAMTPVKGGKFCGSCEKTIVDFRTMNDYQVLQFYKQNNGKICGVFNHRQLNRAMPFPMEVKPTSNWKAIAALAAGVLFSGGLMAQTTPTVGKIAIATETINQSTPTEDTTTPEKIISGTVIDQAVGEGLIGANIIIVGTTIGTSTDLDGHFELKIPANLSAFELEITYTGFDNQTLLFNDKYPIPNQQIEIELTSGPYSGGLIMGIMIAQDFEEAPTCGTDEIITVEEDLPEITPSIEKEITSEQQMTVFPNPFVDNIKVSYDFAEKGDYLFNVYDRSGRLLLAKSYHLSKGEQTVTLNTMTQNLNNGVYILQLSDNQDRILATKKVYKGQP
ncbi:MAG: carboxypeptidase-like regulatory domain-containing protein [Saprospiraceae bacterium]